MKKSWIENPNNGNML
jgi:hypothetical protein